MSSDQEISMVSQWIDLFFGNITFGYYQVQVLQEQRPILRLIGPTSQSDKQGLPRFGLELRLELRHQIVVWVLSGHSHP